MARVNFMTPAAGSSMLAIGEVEQTLALAEELEERSRRENNTYDLVRALALKTRVLLLRGHADRLTAVPDQIETAIRDATDATKAGLRREGIAAAAGIHAALGHRGEAVALLMRLLDEKLGVWLDWSLTGVVLGEIELAERTDGWNGSVSSAVVEEARGNLEAAADGYAEVADECRKRGDVYFLVQALVGLGRVLARLGRTAEAAEALNEARPILVKLEAAPLLAETDALLEQLTALSA
jgi:hypothetical protein